MSCLVELPPSRLLSPVDEMFVESLKVAMKANPSADVAPIVGLVVLEEGQCFQESKKESYQYETLGGNNSRTALQALMKEDDNPIFRSRLVSVYQGLSDEAALRLAAKHNLATSLHHEMTTWEKVCKTIDILRYNRETTLMVVTFLLPVQASISRTHNINQFVSGVSTAAHVYQ